MYPAGYDTFVEVFEEITGKMCGASRPGHFKGVTTVVSKLSIYASPTGLILGRRMLSSF
jgi:pantoate--beta-alanine ligase